MALSGRLLSLNVARSSAAAAGGATAGKAIGKQPVDGPRAVGVNGIDGDETAGADGQDRPAKAVYAYPSEHFAFWRTVRAQAGVAAWDATLAPGSLGENLTVAGVLESDVYIGDVLRFPGCALAVSEAGLPGVELDAALGFPHAAKLMTQSAWCGWYLAVREPGTIAAGERFTIVPGRREVGIGELFRSRMNRP